ncbi:SDR family NAD(P)-dependent oxidoreductase [Luteibacter sp. NPDC031894]|jgi:NAD(P)-dependent dehydrogenase (short-subunit alcohol dehydrogenase family)|uniref:SDR family NAD(P)-dependent oxidoreductase n=1 Tax=Luteibacter sp. NPDC031894 TaxID=3390572 RepID=UPI003CFCF9E1
MHIDLSKRSAIVTGSTAGIGLAIATGLAKAGASVVITGRTQARVDEAIASVKKAAPNAKVTGVAADLGTSEGAAALIKAVPDTDILVNNLGIFEPKDFFEIDDAEWSRYFDVNVISGVRLSRHYAKRMAERGWGRVQFISSESSIQPPPEMVHYGVTKTAQLGVSRGLAEVLAGTGVTVNAVLPGPTLSEGVSEFFGKIAKNDGKTQEEVERDFIQTHRPTSLIKRLLSVDEVANVSVFLASEEASGTTGASFRVDGGVARLIL